ncbi:MAG: serine protease [Bacteroidota bacterium]
MTKLLKLIFVVLLSISRTSFGQDIAQIDNPIYDRRDIGYCDIVKIEKSTQNTTVYFRYTAPSEYIDGGWVCAGQDFYIRDTFTKVKNKLLGANNIPICPSKYGFKYSGQKLDFSLTFEALPISTTKIDIIEDEKNGGFNFYGVDISKTSTNISLNKLPVQNQSWTENSLKSFWVENGTDELEGVYEAVGESYKDFPSRVFALKKTTLGYDLIFLKDKNVDSFSKMNVGDIFMTLKATATQNLFKADLKGIEWYVSFENGFMKHFRVFQSGAESRVDQFIKIFPVANDVSSNKVSRIKSGTGFGIASNGLIITNFHVIDGASSIRVKGVNSDFNKVYNAKILISDKNNDLAIIQIDDKSFSSLGKIPYTVNTALSSVGTNIFVLGYPLRASMGDEIKLTNGIISSRTGYQGDITSYQISAPIQPGNSGGPLFNSQGDLIGVVNAKLSGAENASYAIKSNYLTSLIELLPIKPKLQIQNLLVGKPLTLQVEMARRFIYIIEIE